MNGSAPLTLTEAEPDRLELIEDFREAYSDDLADDSWEQNCLPSTNLVPSLLSGIPKYPRPGGQCSLAGR